MLFVVLLIFNYFLFCQTSLSVPYINFSKKSWNLVLDEDTKDCYIFSSHISSIGNINDKRTSVIFLRKKNKTLQWSFFPGIPLRIDEESDVTLSIRPNGKLFSFTVPVANSFFAFLSDKRNERKLLEMTIKEGNYFYFFFKSVSRNEYSVDIFSRDGFQETYQKMIEVCK